MLPLSPDRCTSVFLRRYDKVSSQDSFLPKIEDEIRILLGLFLLKKAGKELRYELMNHAERVSIPV